MHERGDFDQLPLDNVVASDLVYVANHELSAPAEEGRNGTSRLTNSWFGRAGRGWLLSA
jgi:hypothetical protein